MRISELTEQQKDRLIATCGLRLVHYHRGVRWAQREVIGYLVAAGFCACGALWALTLARGRGLAFVASIPWYSWLTLFGFGGIALFILGWTKFMLHEVTMRAGERAYLMLLFEKCAKQNIEFSADDVASFLRSVPDSMSLTEGKLG